MSWACQSHWLYRRNIRELTWVFWNSLQQLARGWTCACGGGRAPGEQGCETSPLSCREGRRGGQREGLKIQSGQQQESGRSMYIGYRSNCIKYEQAASPDKSGGCSLKAELRMLDFSHQSRQKEVCMCVYVCVVSAHWWSCFLCSLASSLCFSL